VRSIRPARRDDPPLLNTLLQLSGGRFDAAISTTTRAIHGRKVCRDRRSAGAACVGADCRGASAGVGRHCVRIEEILNHYSEYRGDRIPATAPAACGADSAVVDEAVGFEETG